MGYSPRQWVESFEASRRPTGPRVAALVVAVLASGVHFECIELQFDESRGEYFEAPGARRFVVPRMRRMEVRVGDVVMLAHVGQNRWRFEGGGRRVAETPRPWWQPRG